jgi:hypothetical protein
MENFNYHPLNRMMRFMCFGDFLTEAAERLSLTSQSSSDDLQKYIYFFHRNHCEHRKMLPWLKGAGGFMTHSRL